MPRDTSDMPQRSRIDWLEVVPAVLIGCFAVLMLVAAVGAIVGHSRYERAYGPQRDAYIKACVLHDELPESRCRERWRWSQK